jgi:hypothetical protein
MSSFVIDIEANNLYPFQKRIWVICVKKVGTDQRLKLYPYKSSPEFVRKQLIDFIFQDPGIPVIIGHNYLGFDCWCLWKDYNITITVGKDTFCGREVRYFDTLFASQFFLPDRIGGHGLDDWGKRLGDHKIEYRKLLIEKGLLPKDAPPGAEFTFWTEWLDSYCEKDTDVCEQVYVQLHAQLEEEGSHNAFRLGQKTFFLMAAQGFTGFKFDSEKAVALKARIEGMIEDLRREVEPELPPRKLKKTEEALYRIPAKPYTQNGQFSALMNKFIERVGAKVLSQTSIQVNGRTIPIVGHGLIQDTVPMLLDDQNALKDYFLAQNWEPTLWNYKQKDGKPLRDEKGKLIKTSPKLQEAGKICENLLELDGDLPKKITRFMSLRNRLSILTGWLENPRLAWDGRLSAGSSGLAGTHRQRHTCIVNVPKAQDDVLLGKEFRELFTVDKGNKLVGCDQAALEARCEAHWVYEFPGGPERANVLLSGDVHSINCKVFFPKETKDFDINSPDFSKDHPGFKPYRSLSKNGGYCLPMHTEVLTDKGWKKYDDLLKTDTVYSLDIQKDLIVKDHIIEKHFLPDQEVFKYENKLNSFECTENHRWYGWKRRGNKERSKEFGFFEIKDATTEYNIIITKEFEGGLKIVTPDEGAFVGWVLSEGTVDWSQKANITSSSFGKKKGVKCTIAQSEHFFADELRGLLKRMDIPFQERYKQYAKDKTIVTFDIGCAWFREFWDRVVGIRKNKHEINWTNWVLSLTSETRRSFLNAFWLGDGCKNGAKSLSIAQNDGTISDAVQLAYFMEGKKVTTYYKHRSDKCKNITASYRDHITCQELSKVSKGLQDTFCLTTKNGSFVIRQNGFMMLTGNCLAYGGSPKKLASTLRKNEREGPALYDAYWAANPSLKSFKDKLEYVWEREGKKLWITGIDGRRLHSRSKHSLVNLCFQSTGAIIVDYALCLFDAKMGGLKLDSRGRPYYKYKGKTVKRVGYFHDEFQTEDDPTIAEEIGKIMEQCMVEAGIRLKLNVPLIGEAKIGLNWKDCH